MKENKALEEEVKNPKDEIAKLQENNTNEEQKIDKIFQDDSKSIEKCLEECCIFCSLNLWVH